MQSAIQGRHEHSSQQMMPSPAWKAVSTLTVCAAFTLGVLGFTFHRFEIAPILLVLALLVLCSIAVLHARFLYQARDQFRYTSGALETREQEFQSVFENALEAILILDGQAICRDANPSAVQLLGTRREQLIGQSIAIFYPDHRRFDSAWDRLRAQRHSHGRDEILRMDGTHLFVEFNAIANFLPDRHMMSLRDVTQRQLAEEAKQKSLALARSAWQEADALRKATLALAEDLHMDSVLDTLLAALRELVPYESAQVLLLETDSRLFLARESISEGRSAQSIACPETLDASKYLVLQRVLESSDGVLISDTLDGQTILGTSVRSWLGVPLFSSGQVVGLLSASHTTPGYFMTEHLQATRSLAISAAVAIQNARLYERTEIYAAELEQRLADLHEAKQALERSEEIRRTSDDRFQKIFRSSPIAFSVTSLEDGTFIDANEAFEQCFGYSRNELIGRTSTELGFWEDPSERVKLVEQLGQVSRIRGAVSRFRIESGEFRPSFYSAASIQLDGRSCLLLLSEDVPESAPQNS